MIGASEEKTVNNTFEVNTITVSSAEELKSALANANGGETILLEAGSYGNFGLWDVRHPYVKFAEQVTIKSIDPSDPAVFETMKLTGVENLTFDSVKFDYSADDGAASYVKPFVVQNSSGITFKNSKFDGDLAQGVSVNADGYGTGFGLNVSHSSGITVENNEFYNWLRAGVFGDVDDLIVRGNDIHSVSSDGLDFADVDNVLIEENYIHDFKKSSDSGVHMDMIQFWTSGTKDPSVNIEIRQNILDSGDGPETQSIFMRNEAVDSYGAGLEMYYRNLTIEENVILNAHTHGITVGATVGLNIRNNTLLHNKDSANDGLVHVPTINVANAAQNVVIENNIVPRLGLESAEGRVVENNLVVQRSDPEGEAYYGDLFVNALADSSAELGDLKAVPGGLIEQMNVGSSLTRFDSHPDEPSGFIQDQAGRGMNLLTHKLVVPSLFGPEGQMDLTGAKIVWDFGDGTVGSDLTADHTFSHAGTYDVKASVTLADGRIVALAKTIDVQTPIALRANFNADAEDHSDSVNTVVVGEEVSFEARDNGQAVRLNGGLVSYDASPEFLNNTEFTVLFDFKKDVGDEDAKGSVIYFSGSFAINVGSDGITASVNTDAGGKWLKANGIGVNDSDWHNVALTFSGKVGAAVLYVDGAEVARVSGLDGAIQVGSVSHDLHLGNPFGKGTFAGLIDNVTFLRGALSAEEAKTGVFLEPNAEPIEPTAPVEPNPSDDSTSDQTSREPVIGTEESDNLLGGAGSDQLSGGSGNDRLLGDGGHDQLFGGDDKDSLFGGTGNDLLEGGTGNDGLWGDEGDDSLYGDAGSDSLFGGDGQDTLHGGAGVDKLYGGDGNDTIFGDADRDRLFGGEGNDILHGGAGYDGLNGDNGDDQLFGGDSRDILRGGDGNDVLVGGSGKDDLYGDDGADSFVFGEDSGKDIVKDFDAGEDMITLQGLSFLTVADVLDAAKNVKGHTVLYLDHSGGDEVWLIGIDKSDLHDGNISLVA